MIVFVPARGGSKGLPGKNIRPLGGIPLICHSLFAAKASGAVTRVIVTTDDAQIREAALSVAGVEVPFMRPAELSTDTASAIDVYLHAVDWVNGSGGAKAKEFCVLLPTSPLRLPSDIDAAITLYRQRHARVVVSVCEAKPLGFHQNIAPDGQLTPISGIKTSMANRQALSTSVALNGSIYVLDAENLRRTRSYFGERSYGYVMPRARSIDIDEAEDLVVAELLYAGRQRGMI